MTFSLTEECLFCGKRRKVEEKTLWETMLMVFYFRSQDHHGKPYEEPHKSGWVVTVCRECRHNHTVDELMTKAKEVF